ncbi:unnamed protein product [Parnassius apollo]|uniref:(apollo) hypothetical protein n=1 Tax=Parnassius apollo TaxID=110799 RepID=A0A8S3WIT0_PARAO|nr:unnamed protein product [Parnassius apollo]
MYRNKKDVDKHVESLISKLSLKEFKTRAYSVARLYFEVGDYASCQKYVEQYLTYKDNAAAHKLLGQAYHKQGQKEKALEEFKTSLDKDSTQTSIVLDICELLADDEIDIDPGRARYWCEKAEAIFPRHQVTFQLRERLLNIANPDPEALVKLLNAELLVRPRDPLLHARLLKHYLNSNKIKEALEHSCKVEFENKFFSHNYDWYEVVSKVLNHSSHDTKSWLYQLLLLTVKERICLLSLAEIPNGSSKSLIETSDLLFQYDQAIENIAQSGASPGYAEFHSSLLQHHKGQLAFHSATFLLKKAKKDQIGWREAVRLADPLILIAWQTVPLDMKVNWLNHAPEKQKNAVNRWYIEGCYRCSQSGHYVLSNCKDKSQLFLDQISQVCSGPEWKNKLYEKMYTSHEHQAKMNSSYLASNSFHAPTLRLPRRIEVEAYDVDAQRENPNSLHHIVWILLNYKNYANFKCILFDMLKPTVTNCGPEGLNKIDIHAFAYCTALTAIKQKHNQQSFIAVEKPYIVPANITDLLCTLTQMKWWDCAYKYCQNELGTELTDIRATLSAGIEVVRCIDNHGLDPELLCILGRIFSEQAKLTRNENESNELEMRAFLYYSEAIPLLAQLKNKTMIKFPEKRMFDYTHAELSSKELNALIEESKLYVALVYLHDCEFEKVVDLLSNVKTPKGYYYLGEAYKRMAIEEMPTSRDVAFESKCISLLSKAKQFAFKALEKLKNSEAFKNNPLYSQIQDLIEDIEACINKIDPDFSYAINNVDGKNSSDENISLIGSEQFPLRPNHHFRNISSTPKNQSQANITSYRSAIDSQLIETNRLDHQCLERIEKQIKNLQKRDVTINEFMEQTKHWFKENRKLGNEIINTIHSNTENITEQFKLLKISVGEVKSELDECRNECKDVVELKKQVADLKKEVFKLKKVSSDQTVDENDMYNVDENYRSNDNTSTFTPHMPFTPTQVIPPFTQRLVPPFPVPSNPYQLYGQNLYSLYNQYAQFAQPQSVPGAPPVFDPTRGQMNYSNVYPTPDQMYLDVAHLVPPNLSAASTVPTAPPLNIPTIPVVSSTSMPISTSLAPVTTTASVLKSTLTAEVKETLRSLPVNVVITSSDPLPTCTTTAAPILSVTIPPQHIKGSPHNYQIPMPCTNESKAVTSPKFSFSQAGNKLPATTNSSSPWNPTMFTNSQSTNIFNNSLKFDNSKAGFGAVVKESSSPNMSINKSRTLSEKSNTSIENYDPCPDFKPIIPLPAEVKVTTGEEDEVVIFNARAKLFRFVDKQWKERGLGEMKLLQHKITGKVRVLMRREQIHKVCANHIILPEMELKPMKNETKAYFWVANDFAEETVILEKFCVRFKTADIAKQFYDMFEKARQEAASSINSNSTEKETESQTTATPKSQTTSIQGNINDDQIYKTVVGGFTFSSTPSFKAVADVKNTDTSTPNTSKDKVNVFTGLSFKTNAETSFTNLFDTITKQTVTIIPSVQNSEHSNKLNTSDVVEEFEPAVDFKPVVPLPALVDQKTGEEDENILFEHRAKLLRFDASAKEWKERGLGNIKLLVQKDNIQKVRLLMRREQIMKVCCNHAITKEMIFQKMPNMDKAVTWCAKDFSDGELVAETFCLRFKTVQLCDEFVKAVKLAQSKIGDDLKAVKEEQNAAKQNNQISSSNEQTETSSDWSDKFKPKPGCWECKMCYIRNEADVEFCCACESPKDSTAKQNSSNESSTFNFVLPPKSISSQSGWGDKFKPKEGTWECNQCLVRNDSNIIRCSACNNPKDPSTVKNESKSSLINNATGPKFNFGISHTANVQNVKNETSSSFNATGLQKFSFGIPASKSTNVISFGDQKSVSSYFGASKPTEDQPINFSLISTDGGKLSEAQKIIACSTSNPNVLKHYGFSFQAPQNEKEQIKDKQGNDNIFSNIDEAKLPNSPFSSLKEMDIFHITGEDNENLIFGQRANLYKFISGKWEKYAVGIVKILAHQENGKMRILMRGEDLKICLNHSLTHETKLKSKDEKTWHITINYFNEGERCLEHFCLKFPNTELALQFKNAVDKATGMQVKCDVDTKESESDDVVFVGEILASNEEKQKAIELKLPENFYTYKNKPPCQGCRGCKDDDEIINEASTKNNSTLLMKPKSTQVPRDSSISTPTKGSVLNLQSPTNSIYGTPGNFDKTADVSVFRTPLGSVGSNTKSPIMSDSQTENNNTNKENTFTEKSDAFNTFSEQKLTFGSSNGQTNIFSSQPSTVVKKSILAAPKLDSLNTNMSAETKTIFGENKSIFAGSGITTNKPVFDFSSFKKESTQSSDVKSIFGDDQKPVNLFSSSTQGSIFGPSALKVDSTKFGGFNYFGSQSQNSGSNNTIFGKVSNEPVAFGVKSEGNSFNQPGTTSLSVSKEGIELKADEKEKKTELPLKVDNALSFAALSTSGPGFNIQKKADFEWEGAGQQLFTSKSKKSLSEKSNVSNSEDTETGVGADEEYDPHYEPIVPLPDKIVVTTGEEDEEKLFGERCKLFRYDEKSREWKERGVGEIKILYHPSRMTYRLLLRRELVHKAVLNMLLFMDLELLPMKNSDRAWTWAGINYAENVAGEQETLAVRFKSSNIATNFHDKVVECVRKLQAAAAEAIRKEKETSVVEFESVAPLRLPKHLENSARADNVILAKTEEQVVSTNTTEKDTFGDSEANKGSTSVETKQVHFEETEEDDDEYEHNYDHNEEYDDNYNEEEEEESGVYFSCEGEAIVRLGSEEAKCSHAHIQVVFDQDIYSPKIVVTDSNTGEVLADMLIYTETEFQITGDSCSWSGVDYDSVKKTVTINFPDSETAMYFYDSCETSKAATCSSTDPES